MSRQLPPNPHIDVLKKQAKALLGAHAAGQAEVLAQVAAVIDELPSGAAQDFSLRHAQQVLAREYGFSSWQALADHVQDPSENWAAGRFAFYRGLADDLAESHGAGNTSTYGILGEEMSRRMNEGGGPAAAAQDSIAALAGCRDWEALGAAATNAIEIRTVDRQLMTALEGLHDGFTTNVAERIGAQAEVAFVDYTTVCEFLLSLGRPSHSFCCRAQGVEGPFVIDMGPRVIARLSGDGADIAEQLLSDLLSLWPPALAIQNPSLQLFTDPFGMQAGKLYDTCILVAYEIKVDGAPAGLLSIGYPEQSIVGLLAALRAPKVTHL